ncbi:MAG: hypothetical protein IT245_08385 [Bacteroidia bacterium]|nr:hypothetical protein [Bacteroidia bacterium]
MKRIILSFDYEIYFDGRNNYDTLIANTNKILDIARKNNCKLVFFIDIAYVFKLNSTGQIKACEEIILQCHKMRELGHEIEYHFHPHWINAIYDQSMNRWKFDRTEYSFSNIVSKYGIDYTTAWFNKIYEFFIEVIKAKPIAFRAGGLSINDFQKEYIELLHSLDFKFDSSVMPGIKMNGMYLKVDHSSAEDLERWKIGPQLGFFKQSLSNEIVLDEIPVMTCKKEKIGLFSRIKTSVNYRVLNLFNPKRSHYEGGTFDHGMFESIFPTSITFDGSGKSDIVIMKHFTNAYFNQGKKLLCMLSHPKSFMIESFFLLDNYLKWINSQNKIKIVGFKDID